jgi:hypothetical protein
MGYSLQQAAEATGKDPSTIWRSIKKGRISAKKSDAGTLDIDPAELHRVFPQVALKLAQQESLQEVASVGLVSENRELKAKVELLREMVDRLNGLLDKESEERRRLTLMLTHQPKADTPPVLPEIDRQPEASAAVRPAVWFALAAAIIVAAAAWPLWWPWLTGRN